MLCNTLRPVRFRLHPFLLHVLFLHAPHHLLHSGLRRSLPLPQAPCAPCRLSTPSSPFASQHAAPNASPPPTFCAQPRPSAHSCPLARQHAALNAPPPPTSRAGWRPH